MHAPLLLNSGAHALRTPDLTPMPALKTMLAYGGMAEWLKAAVC